MPLTLLIGAARSGKSEIAVRMGEASSSAVVVIATAEARDEEMAERVRLHRRRRPSSWTTIEEPVDLEGAVRSAPEDAFVIVDCLTLWVANLLEAGTAPEEIEDRALAAAGLAEKRPAETLAVTNEVGAGIVPGNALARTFRDVHGRVNTIWGAAAERALLVVAGRVLDLRRPEDLPDV